MGYDYFTVNNMSYHGHNVTIVWQRPGTTQHYPLAPMGYSLYVDGQLAFTASDLVHLTWNSNTGQVQILDNSSNATVVNNQAIPIPTATQVSLTGNARMTNELQDAGINVTNQTGGFVNQALGKTATASFTTTSPAANATSPANAVDGYTTSGLPVTSGSYVGTNPIWGDQGTPNASDWLQIDLGAPTRVNDMKIYFYSNKAFGSGGSTYAQPTAYTLQYFDGTNWDNASNQALNPATPAPNYNEDTFTPATAQLWRVMVTHAASRGVGIKEVQLFNTVPLTTASFVPSGTANGWYPGNVTVTLHASDQGGPGVASTVYQIDGGGWIPYTVPFQVTGEGPHTVQYYSVDTLGNTEPANSVPVNIDTTAPVTTASVSPTPTNGQVNGTATVTLSPTDAGSGVASTTYTIDGGAPQTYTGPFQITAGGLHTVLFHSTDNVGNVETNKTLTVQVNPQVTIGPQGNVPSTLAISLSTNLPSFGSFTPGVAQTYNSSTTATITTTAASSTLTASDTSTTFPGHLVNNSAGGPYDLPSGLQVDASDAAGTAGSGVWMDLSAHNPATLLSFSAPVASDQVTLGFQQVIGATDPLRTGAYTKVVTYTLQTNTP